jgi:hypothetical protein
MPDQQRYDFYAAIRTIIDRAAAAETSGSLPHALQVARSEAQRYQRQIEMLQAELERLLALTAQPPTAPSDPRTRPKRLACHHADRVDATRIVEGDLPPWMIDCSEPH